MAGEKRKLPTPGKILQTALEIAVFLWIMCALPTGWLYDMAAGTGTGQGQRPDEAVARLRVQADVREFAQAETAAAVSGDVLVRCPLLRLRDVNMEGEHVYRRNGAVHSQYIPEYVVPAGGPLGTLARFFGGGMYNRYHLLELEDGSWLCVYFDDYLLAESFLGGQVSFPTGYVRRTTGEEQRMIRGLSTEYPADPDYILDMYRHGKMAWWLDALLRFVLVIAALVLFQAAAEQVRRAREDARAKDTRARDARGRHAR